MAVEFKMRSRLIIPFGFATKWDINKIKVVGVDGEGSYLQSDVPCFYLDKDSEPPLTIASIDDVAVDKVVGPYGGFCPSDIDKVCTYLKSLCETNKEKEFINYYFKYAEEQSLLPLPQAYLYLPDPLKDEPFAPGKCNRIDFLFWDGANLIAVEIDGSAPSHVSGSGDIAKEHIIKDRKFQLAGIQVIHILNEELDDLKERVVKLLPKTIQTGLDFVS